MVYAFEFGRVGTDMVGQVDLNTEDASKILVWAVKNKYKPASVSEGVLSKEYKERIERKKLGIWKIKYKKS